MSITKQTAVDKIEVVGWNIQVREATMIVEDGVSLAKSYSRYVLTPDSDLTGQPQRVADVANSAWDTDTRAAFEAHKAKQAAAEEPAPVEEPASAEEPAPAE